MPVPWLQLIDAALGVANFARGRSAPQAGASQELQAAPPLQGGLEARLAGVVVAALKEAFDRDSRRLELEREQLAAERLRAERAMRLELRRQAADHEIGRQRLLAGVAFAAWIGTLAFSSRVIGGPLGARLALGAGWLFLLGAIASSFDVKLLSPLVNSPNSITRDEAVRVDCSGVSQGVGNCWISAHVA